MSKHPSLRYYPSFRAHILLVLALADLIAATGDEQKKLYIVYLGDPPADEQSAVQRHIDLLSTLKGSDEDARDSLVHSYENFNAFAAKLSADEANKLSAMEGVASVLPNRRLKLHTTRSWDFIGLPQNAVRNLEVESDIIVGLLDTGITPQSESFGDAGFGPPPAKWKGTCGPHYANFSGCNNKLIGARYFKLEGFNEDNEGEIASPVDVEGHGTHTSSTLAGNAIANASLSGLAQGVARGAVPWARVAMYKVCWLGSDCAEVDVLAGFDAAIHDGVDVISVSAGGNYIEYTNDPIAIGSFNAMKKNIITVASAGNNGPQAQTVSNHAPWLLTVAASGVDRQFRSKIVLGNGHISSGIGVSTFDTEEKLYPLVSGADIPIGPGYEKFARLCIRGAIDPAKVNGKVVYCREEIRSDYAVKAGQGMGAIIESSEFLDTPAIYVAPATMVNATTGQSIDDYIHSTKSPSAAIYNTQEVKVPAPFVASFSSRGPSPASSRLLKPDIAAPGISILASYTPLNSLTGLAVDTRHSKFKLMSGTSMACPHVAGVAAYVKSFHPDWSPAAIKSAILTTAKPMSSKVNQDAEYAFGVGQVNPTKAVSPGLIYDMDEMSYLQFLCHEGYTPPSFAAFATGSNSVNCSNLLPGRGYDAINYPTMHLTLTKNATQWPTVGVFRRTVTNVGPLLSVYYADVRAPRGVEITVEPPILFFSYAFETRSFKVVVKAKPITSSSIRLLSGSLSWKSCRYTVRSPIVIHNFESFRLSGYKKSIKKSRGSHKAKMMRQVASFKNTGFGLCDHRIGAQKAAAIGGRAMISNAVIGSREAGLGSECGIDGAEKAGECLYGEDWVLENLRFGGRIWVERGKYVGKESGSHHIRHVW
ncbi:subtilisin-like protease SBT4.14 [Malania oleifera]|uniref:subtilisin-like protease SBT4.14 n=1 Tax=Malania oleifera TaxID=397392 RepID=UPI0025AE0AF3|nr:subtilisin-like protease SBT4.14 [Malania oleifera]